MYWTVLGAGNPMWEGEIADNYTMSRVVDFASAKDLQRRHRRNGVDPIIAEIVFALLECGGEAHRTTVAERVMRARTGRALDPKEPERREIYSAVDAYLLVISRKGRTPMVCLPFGAGSHRWALTPVTKGALEHLRRSEAARF